MSDAMLPPAAVDISRYRRLVAAPARGAPAVLLGLIAFAGGLVAVVVTLAGDGSAPLARIAIGVASAGVLFALFVMLPAQLVRRAVRRRRTAIDESQRDAAGRLRAHCAAIGYAVPLETAAEWVANPDPRATVPLVHDSVIAARWWRPGVDDARVFVEPYLRQGDEASALPVLPSIEVAPGR